MADTKEDRNSWAKWCCRGLYGVNSSPSKQFDTRGYLYGKLCELGYLYQYRGVNAIQRLIGELQSGEDLSVYLSHPIKFNDPFDSLLPTVYKKMPEIRKNGIDITFKSMCDSGNLNENNKMQCYREFEKTLSKKNWDKWIEAIHIIGLEYSQNKNFNGYVLEKHFKDINQEFIDGLRQNVLISCFSEDYTSPAMWHHYADGHQGICLAYHELAFCNYVENDLLSADFLYYHLTPVQYRNDLYTLGKLCKRHILNQINDNRDLNLDLSLIMQIMSTKAECWSYEKEWRLIFLDSKSSLIKENRVIMKPSCIYLGAKINPYYAQILKELGRKRGIQVKQLVMADTKYQLVEKK